MGATGGPSGQELFQLLGDPVRWQLLEHLRRSDHRVGDLVQRTGRAQNVVSYHLGELRRAGIVSGRRSAADGRDTYYRVRFERLDDLLDTAVTALDPTLRVDAPEVGPLRVRRPRPHVLFLCTGNSARSQIAEALAVHRSQGTVDARSAGSHPKPVHPNAVRVLAERGIDISGATSTHLDAVRRWRVDRVVTLCDKVKEVCPELPGDPRPAHWSMADPATTADSDDATYPAFVATADDIDERVRRLLVDLQHTEEGTRAHR